MSDVKRPRDARARVAGTQPGARARWSPRPEDVRKSVLKLVLTLVELIRRLLERQAVRRMQNGTLSETEIEAIGAALAQLERTVHELAADFDLALEDLNLDLGPLGRLM